MSEDIKLMILDFAIYLTLAYSGTLLIAVYCL